MQHDTGAPTRTSLSPPASSVTGPAAHLPPSVPAPARVLDAGTSRAPLLVPRPDERASAMFRFAETEALATIAAFTTHYEIGIMHEPRFAHESFEQRKERVLQSRPGITTT